MKNEDEQEVDLDSLEDLKPLTPPAQLAEDLADEYRSANRKVDTGTLDIARPRDRFWLGVATTIGVAGVLAAMLCGIIAIRILIGGLISDNSNDSGLNFDGVAVMVVEDESENPRRDWERGQVSTLTAIRNWATQHATKVEDIQAYMAVDRKATIKEQFWSDLRDAAKLKPPTVLVLSGKRLTEFQVPTEDAVAIKKLNAASR